MKILHNPALTSKVWGIFQKKYVFVPLKETPYLRRRYKEPCHSPRQERIRQAFLSADLVARELSKEERECWHRWARQKGFYNWYCGFMSLNIKRVLEGKHVLRACPLTK